MDKQITLDTFTINSDKGISLEPCSGWPRKALHHFDREQALAILAARAIKRPLLVRGEPGCGKTQMARAAAQLLCMPLAWLVVNERTETEDLFWKYDALRRLSDANNPEKGVQDESEYLSAGPLWWALNHGSAADYKGRQSSEPYLGKGSEHPRDYANGVLLLIDEIDKADRSVPNSLLEAMGNYSFDVPCINHRVECEPQNAPLVIITTNDEQELPPAFVRRCLVLDITFKNKAAFVITLAKRGKALLGNGFDSDEIYNIVASQLWAKREEVAKAGATVLPGQAEYLDHLEAILAMKEYAPGIKESDAIEELGRLMYNKSR